MFKDSIYLEERNNLKKQVFNNSYKKQFINFFEKSERHLELDIELNDADDILHKL